MEIQEGIKPLLDIACPNDSFAASLNTSTHYLGRHVP